MLQGGVTPVPYLSRRMTGRATMLQGGEGYAGNSLTISLKEENFT